MTDPEERTTASTPLRRAAARLRAVLPPGWHVEIVDAPRPSLPARDLIPGQEILDETGAVLRVVMP